MKRGQIEISFLLAFGVAAASLAQQPVKSAGKASVTRAEFGRMPDGAAVELFTLTNAKGIEARVIS